MLIKHVLTEKKTHIGGEAKFGYVHLANHSELYFTKEIKQRFKVLGIPFKQTTSLEMVQFPPEVVSLMVQASSIEADDLYGISFKDYVNETLTISKEMRDKALKSIVDSEDLTQEQKDKMIHNLREDEKHVEMLFDDLDKTEKTVLTSFLKDGYEKLYRVVLGSSSLYYLVKTLDDRISFFVIEAMRFRNKEGGYALKLANIKTFYLTKAFMKAFLEKVNKKGVDVL